MTEKKKTQEAIENVVHTVENENLQDDQAKKSRGRPKKTEETFSDEDMIAFKEFMKNRKDLKEEVKVKCDAPSDDPIRRAWKAENRMVKGIFRCREPAGGSVTFPFKKYKWDPVRFYTFIDGETYEIPLMVARHLNENCNYAEHTNILGPNGAPTINRTGKMHSRMNFESLEFAVA